jgi:hypothetical protein
VAGEGRGSCGRTARRAPRVSFTHSTASWIPQQEPASPHTASTSSAHPPRNKDKQQAIRTQLNTSIPLLLPKDTHPTHAAVPFPSLRINHPFPFPGASPLCLSPLTITVTVIVTATNTVSTTNTVARYTTMYKPA